MPKWEYCVLGPLTGSAGGVAESITTALYYFTLEGARVKELASGKFIKEVPRARVATVIAQLGEAGWEMVTAGAIPLLGHNTAHMLYFKRPIQQEPPPEA